MLDAKGVMEPWQEPRQARGWLVLALGIVVFAAFGVVVGYAYFKGLPGIGGEPPLIRAEPGPYRHAPDDRGGLAVANANSSIVTVLRPQGEPPRVERLLPPETAGSLESAEPEIAPAPEAASPEPSPQLDAATPPDQASLPPGIPYPRSKPLPPGAEEPVVEPQAADLGALPPVEPAAPPPPEAPAPEPAPVPERLAAREPAATAEPGPGPRPLVRAEPEPPAAPAAPALGAGIYRLQLAAVRSENGLTQAWADLRQRYPAALGTVNPQVERTDTTSGPLYRLQAGPFTSREAAANACGAIRGSGGQCFIVGPIAQ